MAAEKRITVDERMVAEKKNDCGKRMVVEKGNMVFVGFS